MANKKAPDAKKVLIKSRSPQFWRAGIKFTKDGVWLNPEDFLKLTKES